MFCSSSRIGVVWKFEGGEKKVDVESFSNFSGIDEIDESEEVADEID